MKNTLSLVVILMMIIGITSCKKASAPDDDSKYSGDKFTENIRSTDARTPQEELAGFKVPEGFEISLFASEPDIDKPINLAFDAKGRMWVTQSFEYPFPSSSTPKGTDRITILEDTDGDGKADKFTDVADTVNIPIGILPLNDGAVTFSIPSIYRYTDTNGDDKMESQKTLLGPFGYQDTHGMVSNFMRGYDGWVHVCHGFTNRSTVAGTDGDSIRMVSGNTFRFKLDGSRVEQMTFGQVNPFGLVFDSLGYVYSTDSHSSPLYQLIRGADYPHFGKNEIMAFAPDMKSLENEATALCGISQYADVLWPKEFQGNFFIGDVVNCRVHRYTSVFKGSTPVGKSEIDLVKSEDPWFRPVNIKLGPDGALYIADFYNAIIGHYEVPLGHPKRDKKHGRIWRVAYKGTRNKVSNLTTASLDELINTLASNNLPTRMAAADQIADRIGASAVPSLKAVLEDKSTTPRKYILALWLLQRLNAVTEDDIEKSLVHPDPLVRLHTLRVIRENASSAKVYPTVVSLLKDKDAHVQRAATELMMSYPTLSSVQEVIALQHGLPETDTHLVYTTQLCLRNLLRHEDLLSEVVKKQWDQKDAASIAFVMVDIYSAEAAQFLSNYIGQYPYATAKIPLAYKHITRYIPQAQLNGIIKNAMDKNANDIDVKARIFNGIQEGLAERGIKGDATSFNKWAGEIADGVLTKYPATYKSTEESIALQQLGIALAGDYKVVSLEPTLKELLMSSNTAMDIKTSSLRSLLKISRDKNMEIAGSLLQNDSANLAFRKKIVDVVGEFPGGAMNKVLGAVKNTPADLQIAIVMALASSSEGKTIIFQQVRSGAITARTLMDPKVAERMQLDISSRQQKEFDDLTANLDPIDKERQQLIDDKLNAFLAVKQNTIQLDSGQQVYNRNCSVCHRRVVSTAGAGIGPQLHGIGKRGAAALAEKILDPNRNISEAFRSYTIKLKDGKILTGLYRRDEGAVIVFADLTGKEFSVPKKDITEQKASKFTIMPDNFGKTLSQDEFNALLAYLLNS